MTLSDSRKVFTINAVMDCQTLITGYPIVMKHFPIKTNPFSHQRDILQSTCLTESYGLLWEQGCGKTKPIIDTAAYLYSEGLIDGVLIVAPPGVERNWITDEIPAHLNDDIRERTETILYRTSEAHRKSFQRESELKLKHDGLLFLAISYNAFMTVAGKNFVWNFMKRRRFLYALDEAHYIKTPNAKRTKAIIASAKYASYRRLLTGTPLANGPFDIYSQIRFLDDNFWKRQGMASFQAFKSRYGIFETMRLSGRSFEKLLEYRDVDDLKEKISTITHRVRKEDVLDLPPKLYQKRTFQLSAEQRRIYSELAEHYETILRDGTLVEADLPIVRLTRFMQIVCGYVSTVDDETGESTSHDIPGDNPRMSMFEEVVESIDRPCIVWARFTRDIDLVVNKLIDMGKKVGRYDGKVSPDECAETDRAFKAGDIDFIVANAAKGKEGLTWHRAKFVIYYSNSFKLLDRLQSEDRAHRAGMDDNAVTYIDICAEDTVDERVIHALREKRDIARLIQNDPLSSWI